MWSADSGRERIQMLSDYNKIIKQHIQNDKTLQHCSIHVPVTAALQYNCNLNYNYNYNSYRLNSHTILENFHALQYQKVKTSKETPVLYW